MGTLNFSKKSSNLKLNRIQAILSIRPMNIHEISRALPLSKRWSLEYIRHLHNTKQIHILRWDKHIEDRTKRHAIEVWTIGDGEDAIRPKADGQKARSKRAWDLRKVDPEKYINDLNKRRLRQMLAKPKPDKAAAWVFAPTTKQASAST